MGKTSKGGERFTIVTGHILLAVFGKETLLNSHNRDTTAKDENGREPLNPEKRDAIIRKSQSYLPILVNLFTLSLI